MCRCTSVRVGVYAYVSCVRVCAYVCKCVCAYVDACVPGAYGYVGTRSVRMYAYVRICMSMRMCVCAYGYVGTCTYVCVCTYMYVYEYMYVRMCVCVYVRMFTYVYVCMCTRTLTQIPSGWPRPYRACGWRKANAWPCITPPLRMAGSHLYAGNLKR